VNYTVCKKHISKENQSEPRQANATLYVHIDKSRDRVEGTE